MSYEEAFLLLAFFFWLSTSGIFLHQGLVGHIIPTMNGPRPLARDSSPIYSPCSGTSTAAAMSLSGKEPAE